MKSKRKIIHYAYVSITNDYVLITDIPIFAIQPKNFEK